MRTKVEADIIVSNYIPPTKYLSVLVHRPDVAISAKYCKTASYKLSLNVPQWKSIKRKHSTPLCHHNAHNQTALQERVSKFYLDVQMTQSWANRHVLNYILCLHMGNQFSH